MKYIGLQDSTGWVKFFFHKPAPDAGFKTDIDSMTEYLTNYIQFTRSKNFAFNIKTVTEAFRVLGFDMHTRKGKPYVIVNFEETQKLYAIVNTNVDDSLAALIEKDGFIECISQQVRRFVEGSEEVEVTLHADANGNLREIFEFEGLRMILQFLYLPVKSSLQSLGMDNVMRLIVTEYTQPFPISE